MVFLNGSWPLDSLSFLVSLCGRDAFLLEGALLVTIILSLRMLSSMPPWVEYCLLPFVATSSSQDFHVAGTVVVLLLLSSFAGACLSQEWGLSLVQQVFRPFNGLLILFLGDLFRHNKSKSHGSHLPMLPPSLKVHPSTLFFVGDTTHRWFAPTYEICLWGILIYLYSGHCFLAASFSVGKSSKAHEFYRFSISPIFPSYWSPNTWCSLLWMHPHKKVAMTLASSSLLIREKKVILINLACSGPFDSILFGNSFAIIIMGTFFFLVSTFPYFESSTFRLFGHPRLWVRYWHMQTPFLWRSISYFHSLWLIEFIEEP